MNEYKATYTIQTGILTVVYEGRESYKTVEALKDETKKIVSAIAAYTDISGEFNLNVTIEKNGEYYDSDEATANYTNGVLTIEA